MEYTIIVKETLERELYIEADSEELAIEEAEKMYDEEVVILDWQDLKGVTYEVKE